MNANLPKNKLFAMVLAVLLLGAAGGAAGGFWAASKAGGSYNFSGGYADQGLVITNAKNVTVEQDRKADETLIAVSASLLGIYKKQKAVKAEAVFAPENFYKLSAAAGQGFAVTADGWIVTALPLEKNFADYVVIAKDKKIYQIDRAAADPLTGLTFIHVAADDLPVRKLAAKREIKKGSLALAVGGSGLSQLTAVAGFSDLGGAVKNSDDFADQLVLSEKLPADFKGAVLFNLAGDGLGMAGADGGIELMSSLSGALKSLFKSRTVARPGLGVNYYDLDELAPADGLSGAWQKGAVIYRNQAGIAVKKGSPADIAGFKEGDVITAVNGAVLDKDNELYDLIESAAAGDKISLTYLRAGAEKIAEITLAASK